jgi:hypothetical protein
MISPSRPHKRLSMRFLNSPGRMLERTFRSNAPGIWNLTPQRPVDNRTSDIEKCDRTEGECQNATR